MQQWVATLIAAGAVVFAQLLTAAFVYGKLTERVKHNSDETVDLKRRMGNAETVISGSGGHGERLTALEAWRLDQNNRAGK